MYKATIETSLGSSKVIISSTNSYGNVITVQRPYTHREDALQYLIMHKRNWVADKLRRYIQHGAKLFESSEGAFYKTLDRCNSMDNCSRFLPYIADSKLMRLSAFILEHEHDLTQVLPNPKNTSYKSSFLNLKELLWVSMQLRKSLRMEGLKSTLFFTDDLFQKP